ncbi:MAG: hypothetical protein M1814_006101 [Vezdaea aestivalis]|nr:MAG: hypothetical protein M1814_006101 [Vezdaea aestivalis]
MVPSPKATESSDHGSPSFTIPVPLEDLTHSKTEHTFGVEFEFHLVENDKLAKEAGILPQHQRSGFDTQAGEAFRTLIGHFLSGLGVTAAEFTTSLATPAKPDYDIWNVMDEELHEPPTNMIPAPEQNSIHAVELVIRILTLSEVRREIPFVLRNLKDRFDVCCSSSCGTHVHVGRRDRSPWTAEFLQKFALVILNFEWQIDGLHAEGRIAYGMNDTNRIQFEEPTKNNIKTVNYGMTLMAISYAVLDVCRSEKWSDDAERYRTRKLGMLLATVGCAKYTKFNFAGFLKDMDKSTIEFRQHTGTLDGTETIFWIRFLDHLIQWVQSQCLAGILQLVLESQDIDRDDFTTMEFLSAIGTPPDVIEYYRDFAEAQYSKNLRVADSNPNIRFENHFPYESKMSCGKPQPAEIRAIINEKDPMLRLLVDLAVTKDIDKYFGQTVHLARPLGP